MGNGFSHIGVSTLDMPATIKFYEEVLGIPRVADNKTRITEGGVLRQVYFEVGDGQYVVFMEPRNIRGIPAEYDTGINTALGLPGGMYHFALKVLSLEGLEARRREIESHGVEVSSIIDLGHAKSIFLFDPNNIQLELCCDVRNFDESDLYQESEASIALTE